MKKLVVNKKYDNKKLDKFLKDNISTLSNNLFYKTLRKKDIKINGKRVSENVTVFENDEILVYIPDYLLENKLNLDIIYEDNNILLINKPSNIEVTGQDSLTEVVHKLYSSCEFNYNLIKDFRGKICKYLCKEETNLHYRPNFICFIIY